MMGQSMKFRIQSPEEIATRKANGRRDLLAMPRKEAADLVTVGMTRDASDLKGLTIGLAVGITDNEDGDVE